MALLVVTLVAAPVVAVGGTFVQYGLGGLIPDGQTIVAESFSDIVSARADGSSVDTVDLTGAYDNNDLVPAWSPDGSEFATGDLLNQFLLRPGHLETGAVSTRETR